MSDKPSTFLDKQKVKKKTAAITTAGANADGFDPNGSTYVAWCNMLLRCYSAAHVAYARYGGRGIEVHHSWKPFNLDKYVGRGAHFIFNTKLPPEDKSAFDRFVKDVGLKPSKFYSLDRIDPNGNYEPKNVRWATAQEQGVNKAIPAKRVPHPQSGAPVLAADLARELGISYQLMRARMVKAGVWNTFDPTPEEKATTEAAQTKKGLPTPPAKKGEADKGAKAQGG